MTSGRYQNWHQWRQVIHGPAALDDLGGELGRLGSCRALIVTTGSLVAEAHVVALVAAALGDRHVGTFGGARRGTPRQTVLAAAAAARAAAADILVSVGGGSTVDTAKGAAMAVAFGVDDAAGFDPLRVGAQAIGLASPELPVAPRPIIAVPTTLSGAEYTGMIAITDESTGHRDPYRFDALAPDTVVLDPRATLATPARLWAATGVKSLNDAFEQFASGTAGPAFEPQLLAAIGHLARSLVASLGGDLTARLDCQLGSWLTLFATFNVSSRVGIAAAIRHQLGMRYGLPHGEATCPVLAEVARRTCPDGDRGDAVLAATISLEPLAGPVAPGAAHGDRLAARFAGLVAALGLPGGLVAAGLAPADVADLARYVAGDFANRHRTSRVWDASEIVELLEAAS